MLSKEGQEQSHALQQTASSHSKPPHRRISDQRDEIAPPHGLPFNEPEDTLAQPDNDDVSQHSQIGR
jgi:hypothetical protein